MFNVQRRAVLFASFFFLTVALFSLSISAQTSTGSPVVTVSHAPASPRTSDSVVITAVASDSDGIQSITIFLEQVPQKTCENIRICQVIQSYSIAGPYTYYVLAVDTKGFITQTSFKTFRVSLVQQPGSSYLSSPSGPSSPSSPSSPSNPSSPSGPSAPVAYPSSPSSPSGSAGISACNGVVFSRNLGLGSTGADVKCLQALLNLDSATRIASSGAGSPGYESLYFGNLTRTAVIKFQEKHKSETLTPVGKTQGTGFAGAYTRIKLNSLLSSISQ